MRNVIRTVGQGMLLLLLGLVVGLGSNAVRGKNRIDLARNYVPKVHAQPTNGTATQATPEPVPHAVVQFDELWALVNDPGQIGMFVVIDARSEHAYGEGHIPGALRCDPYAIEYCYPELVEPLAAAGRVIVYCNGGQCEDSHLMCQELIARGVPEHQLCVYQGGWEEWQARSTTAAPATTPVETTPAPDATDSPVAIPAAEPAEVSVQEIGLDEMVALFSHAKAQSELYFFVDAREEEEFAAGHIPGAHLCDFYRIDFYRDEVVPRAKKAELVIVYCSDPNCEDSLALCGELVKHGVPADRLRVFRGGWKAWTEAGDLPTETGAQ